jgi:hypothetical protein
MIPKEWISPIAIQHTLESHNITELTNESNSVSNGGTSITNSSSSSKTFSAVIAPDQSSTVTTGSNSSINTSSSQAQKKETESKLKSIWPAIFTNEKNENSQDQNKAV